MTTRRTRLRIAGLHMAELRSHLFPGDDREAVAFALCGRHRGREADVLLVQEVLPIPHADCRVRERDRVTWSTDALEGALSRAASSGLGVVKFHSHPRGCARFSELDDRSDRDLFESVYGWIDDEGPHASIVITADGFMFGRTIDSEGGFEPLDRILLADDDIELHAQRFEGMIPAHAERHAQLFGERTTNVLRRLSVGVVGCSGTGSFVIEMLARLGVRELVLVDPDRVEYRNLNRIVGATSVDAALNKLKVDVLGAQVARMGLGTRVLPVPLELASREEVQALGGCDLVFGCMDSHAGRLALNRLASFYVQPYFDCGVGLRGDGAGGVEDVAVASHYVQPGRSTLLGRGVVRQKRAEAEAMARADPDRYRALRAEKYIEGVEVDSPAVVSINALAASLVVNELLARLHPFRLEPNDRAASVRLNVVGMDLDLEPEGDERPLRRTLGRGDVEPPLDMSHLSGRG